VTEKPDRERESLLGGELEEKEKGRGLINLFGNGNSGFFFVSWFWWACEDRREESWLSVLLREEVEWSGVEWTGRRKEEACWGVVIGGMDGCIGVLGERLAAIVLVEERRRRRKRRRSVDGVERLLKCCREGGCGEDGVVVGGRGGARGSGGLC
jgi:hypothetical protein